MKKTLTLLLTLFLVLCFILLFNTLKLKSEIIYTPTIEKLEVSDEAVNRFSGAIKYKTISSGNSESDYSNEFLGLKPYIYGLSGTFGLNVATLYNSQRSPRLDESWYYKFYGIVVGLIFSSELYEALATVLTPSETFILSQDEYEQNYK